MTVKLRICNKCGWAHFPRSREDLQKETDSFGAYITSVDSKTQDMFGYGPLSKTKREWDPAAHFNFSTKCFNCGNSYTDFHDETEADNIPDGVTVQGILYDV